MFWQLVMFLRVLVQQPSKTQRGDSSAMGFNVRLLLLLLLWVFTRFVAAVVKPREIIKSETLQTGFRGCTTCAGPPAVT